jgi:hypothetical protein
VPPSREIVSQAGDKPGDDLPDLLCQADEDPADGWQILRCAYEDLSDAA